MLVSANAHLRLLDRPCGSGKTTEMIKSFKPDQRYLIVVPLLSEVERVIEQSKIPFWQPEDTKEYPTKKAHFEVLLREERNIVITHALYQESLSLIRNGLVDGYHIIIDEVPSVAEVVDSVSELSLDEFYVATGYIEIADDGLITPTSKWEELVNSVSDTLKRKFYYLASTGSLYRTKDGYVIWSYPKELLTAGLSVTVMTYLAKGTHLYCYLIKNEIPFIHDVDPIACAKARRDALALVEVRAVPQLERYRWSYTAQAKLPKDDAEKVANALLSIRRKDLKNVPLEKVLIVSRKDRWFRGGESDPMKRKQGAFAKGSKLFKRVQWVPNTTRGTNDYAAATHMIYLFDQFSNAALLRFLGVENQTLFNEQYALSELVQVIYRTAVRRGEKVVVYIPSERMRRVFEDYRNSGVATRPLAA